MEIIGKSLPYLNQAISSGFDSIATGIQKSTHLAGLSAISSAFEDFSADQTRAFDAADFLPAVTNTGEFPGPATYFENQINSLSKEASLAANEFLGFLWDQNFSPAEVLTPFAGNGLFRSLANQIEHDPFLHAIQKKARELEKIREFNEFKNIPLQDGGVPVGSENIKSEVSRVNYSDGKDAMGFLSPGEAVNDELSDLGMLYSQQQGSILNEPARRTDATERASEMPGNDFKGEHEPEYIPESSQYPGPGYPDPIGVTTESALRTYNPKEPEYLQGDPNVQKPQTGSSSEADQKGIIVVGGVPVGNQANINHLNAPPAPIVPNPEPAHLTQPQSGSGSAPEIAWGPELNGQAEVNNAASAAMEKAKELLSRNAPEYLSGELPTNNKSGAGSASGADQRGIIVVGGKEDAAAQRGIIIVGGKSDGTFLETIDDTIGKLNQDTTPETYQLFQQQIGALQDLSLVVTESVRLSKHFGSAVLTSRMRV